jgi:hypothetical protein
MATKLVINPGQTYGKFTVISEAERVRIPSGQKNRMFLCRCECGKEKTIRLLHLVRGRILSCGCDGFVKHGMTSSEVYTTWRGMKNRCYGEKTIQPHLYKDKGITVCKEWKRNFIVFRDWAFLNGFKHGLQLDRIENDKGYSPENCRFVTPSVNGRNKDNTLKVIYKGVSRPLKEVLDELNISDRYYLTHGRIKRGWDHEKAITTPPRKGNYIRNSNGISSSN